MGKRRTDIEHKDPRNMNDDDDDEEDDSALIVEEPLSQEQIESIKQRKKIVPKRKLHGATSDVTKSAFYSSTMKPFTASNPNTTENEEPKSVFSGFKGFTGFKPLVPTNNNNNNNNNTSSSITSSSLISQPEKEKANNSNQSIFTNGFNRSTTTSAENSSNLQTNNTTFTSTMTPMNNQILKTNGDSTSVNENRIKTPDPASSNLNSEASKNINEMEMKFIVGLNQLYEQCYGGSMSKRHYKLPVDASSSGKVSLTEDESDAETKYASLLAELNKNCSKWIGKHVEESPFVILTPVFVDYFNYLILLEKRFFPDTYKQASSSLMNSENKTTSFNGDCSATLASGYLNGHKENNSNASSSQQKNESSKIPSEKQTTPATTTPTFNANLSDKHAPQFPSLSASGVNSLTPIPISSIGFKFGSAIGAGDSTTNNATSFKITPIPSLSLSSLNSKQADATISTTPKLTTNNKISPESPVKSPEISFISTSKPSSETKFQETTTPSFANNNNNNVANSISTTTTPVFKFGSDNATTSSTASSSAVKQTTSSFLTPKTTNENSTLITSTITTTNPTTQKTDTTPANPITFFSLLNNANKDKTPVTPLNNESTSTNGTSTSIFKGFGFSSSTTTTNPTELSTNSTTNNTTSSLFSFNQTPQNPTINLIGATPSFLGGSATNSSTNSTPFLNFAQGSNPLGNATTKPGLFGSGGSIFGGSVNSMTPSPFQINATNTGGGGENAEGADEEEYQPPKPESSDVKEEGAVFTKRIKMYYFNDKEKKFSDRGIGNLFVKPTKEGESYQLIIRADNKLANILLNVKLNKLFPVTKEGAKDVSYLCLPNPPIQNVESTVPCKFLFKVKTENDAIELFEKLNEYKK